MLICGDIQGDWEIDFSILTTNNCGNEWKGSNEGVEGMFPHFQSIKEPIVSFTTNKIIQGYVGKVVKLRISDALGTSRHSGSADNMLLNPTFGVLSAITRGGCSF